VKEGPRRRIFRLPFRSEGLRSEVEEELRFHIRARAEKYESEGMSPDEAMEAALRRFGDMERVKREVEVNMRKSQRAIGASDMIDTIRQDVTFAGRQLLKNPGFSVIAILTIALGIGATTSIFSVVDGIMLRPLPYDEPDELVMVWADYTRRDVILPDLRREWLSWPNFADFRDGVAAVEHVAAFGGWGPTLTGAGDAERLRGGRFSHGMFSDVLGVQPAVGRTFLPEEDRADGPLTVLLSHGLWQRAFGADPGVVGSSILLNDEPYEVVGIMPANFSPPAFLGADIWTSLQLDDSNGGGRGGAFLRSVGRLGDGATLEVARAQASQLGARLEQEYPRSNQDIGYNVYPLQYDMVQQASTALWVLLGAVGFVLLIACVNVANLLLARGASRSGELAVRAALGAGGRRILRQLMTESLIMAVLGGVLGIALSFAGTGWLVSLAPPGTPLLEQVAVDARILFFAATVTGMAGLLFGILPALKATRTQPAATLREGGRSGTGRRSGALRSSLVVGQVALALVLLVGAGLLVRSFQNLRDVDLGFEPEGVLTMVVQLPGARYPDAEARRGFFGPLEAQLLAIPGIESVGAINALPLAGQDGDTGFEIEGAPPPESGRRPAVWLRVTTPGYFDAMGLRLVAGRSFTMTDTDDQPRVIMINETLANRYFDGDAVGKRINVNSPDSPVWREIVGVVGDIKNFGIRAESRNAMYVPYYQFAPGFMFATMRTSVDPVTVMGAVRAEVSRMDPGIAVAQLQPMSDWVDGSLSADRFTTSLLTGFAAVALILALVGLYGIVSYSVQTRLREVGVRIALGAESTNIRGLILRWSLRLAVVGIALGALGAASVTRLMEGLLFGVGATDVPTFGGVALLMGLATLLASFIPAVRATRVDPIQVLRSE
jgi:predicted permease